MVKDPWWLYAYWEVDPTKERETRRQLAPEEIGDLRSVLRVYDVTDRDYPRESAHQWFDIPLSGLASNWYIHVNAPNRSFIVELGLLTKQGRFLMLLRSNRVTTPRVGPSDVIDEEWMTSDEAYWKLFGTTAGIGVGASAQIIHQIWEQKISSPGMFSPGLFAPAKKHGFWLAVDTELIVHGATDPKATVTIQGQAVTPKADGSFSVRLAMPDGTYTIPVEAVTPDRQTKMVTAIVTRRFEDSEIAHRSKTAAAKKANV